MPILKIKNIGKMDRNLSTVEIGRVFLFFVDFNEANFFNEVKQLNELLAIELNEMKQKQIESNRNNYQ
jgi:hypothetical protein